MKKAISNKSTVAEIRARFDGDVERFANLETGQQSTVDAPISLELITEAARHSRPAARSMLDVGSGAGNYTLKMLQKIGGLDCSLVDLSLPMLQRARERVAAQTTGEVKIFQADIRELQLPEEHFDIIVAGAVLHHLREEAEWEAVFKKLYNALAPGGCLWISDLIVHDAAAVNSMIWQQYGLYLEQFGGAEYRDKVLAYIDQEDSPRSLNFQLDLLKHIGFRQVEVLHKNLCFAAFGGIK